MRTTTSAYPWVQGKWRSKEEQRLQALDLSLKILVPLLMSVCFVVAIKVGSFSGYLQLLSSKSFGSPIMTLGAGFTLAYLAFQLVRTVLWWRYKSYPLPPGPLPRVTVIIPAFNEGAMVEKAIYAAAASDYPADRLEIICIDDGSKDDTWTYIDRAQRRYPKLIKAIRFPENRGKKEGLYTGFTQGQGEFFVTIDSDSLIKPDTVRQVIAPMLQDPKIGAVAGNVKVFNRVRSFMGRMLAVRFVLAFDFLRASQSMYGFVTCTPGALSAYRLTALETHPGRMAPADLHGPTRQDRRRPGPHQPGIAPGLLHRLSAQRPGLHQGPGNLPRPGAHVSPLGPHQLPGKLGAAQIHL